MITIINLLHYQKKSSITQLLFCLFYFFTHRNCYSTHLMQYVLAKMLIATKRLQQSPGFDPSILIISRLRGDELRIEDPGPSRRSDHDLHGIAGN